MLTMQMLHHSCRICLVDPEAPLTHVGAKALRPYRLWIAELRSMLQHAQIHCLAARHNAYDTHSHAENEFHDDYAEGAETRVSGTTGTPRQLIIGAEMALPRANLALNS